MLAVQSPFMISNEKILNKDTDTQSIGIIVTESHREKFQLERKKDIGLLTQVS